MEITHLALDSSLQDEELVNLILGHCNQEERSLVSGAHQMLLSDGRIETFGQFAEITGRLALDIQRRIAQSRLFLQMNDQLSFEGISSGDIPRTGTKFWNAPWEEIEDEGHHPNWPIEALLGNGINIRGEAVSGVMSEWWLQRWHRRAGLNNKGRFNNPKINGEVHGMHDQLLPKEALNGASCRANGCAHEIMVEAPFFIERGYRQLIGLWPIACKGSVLFGTTLSCLAMERGMHSSSDRETQIKFEGPFRYVNVFMNTQDRPQSLQEILDGASIITVETHPQAPLPQNRQEIDTEE